MDPEILRRILHARDVDLHVAAPGTIVSYDSDNQVCDVAIATRAVLPGQDPELDADLVEDYPILSSVPVAFPSGGGVYIHFPLTPGQPCLVVFCDADTNAWRANGSISDPGTDERHGLSGAVVYPGLRPRNKPIDGPTGFGGLQLGVESGGPVLNIGGGHVDCGGTDPLALAAVTAHLQKISADLAAAAPGVGFTPTYVYATEIVANPIATSTTRGA